ncbi:L-rhamnose mutarotase [Halocatena halophila]|uniref:L-rhamnose mutarotase n=1 Tax=Halocatena halophila TaxID=2814576 RepID=UPI002ED313CD
MERIAFQLRIEEGKRDDYRTAHEEVPEWLETAYLDSDAGIERYSVFEADGTVFGVLELENPEAFREVMAESEAQSRWDEHMSPILTGDEPVWLDEVYRLC